MIRSVLTTGLAAVAVVGVAMDVSASGEQQKLFPFQAVVEADGAGLCRIDLPAEVFRRCRGDLSDLRVFDAREREVPYIVQGGLALGPGWEVVHRVRADVLGVERHWQRPENGAPMCHEIFTLAVPALVEGASAWNLEVVTARAEFVRSVELEGWSGDGTQTFFRSGGSVFRLANPVIERTLIELPAGPAARVEVRLGGEDTSYLKPSFRFEARRDLAARHMAIVPLDALEYDDLDDHSVIVLDRPSGLVPTRLRLTTSTGAFNRVVQVWDDGFGAGRVALGKETLFRLDAVAPVESMELPVQPAQGSRLRLVIVDRDSPPLEDLTVAALMPQPALFVSLPEGSRTATLRFGGGRAHRPDYDLSGLQVRPGATVTGQEAEKAEVFIDPGQASVMRVGPVLANPEYDPAPALAFAMHPGATLDVRLFSHTRRLVVEPSAEGLARLRLGPEDLAVARHDLADLRIVDDESRQWAYLLEPDAGYAAVPLTVERRRRVDDESVYRFALPVTPLEVNELVLHLEEPFFDRAFEIRTTSKEAGLTVLAKGRLVRRDGDPRPVSIRLRRQRVEDLELAVRDGNDAPLPLSRVVANCPQPDLFVVAPMGELSLLSGHPDLGAPTYELERVRATILAVPARAIVAGELGKNPNFSPASRLTAGSGPQRVALWLAIGLAVVALAALTLRLARQESGDEDARP